MNNENEILLKLINIEATTEEIYKEIIKIRKSEKDKNFEFFQIMARIENIEDLHRNMLNKTKENMEN